MATRDRYGRSEGSRDGVRRRAAAGGRRFVTLTETELHPKAIAPEDVFEARPIRPVERFFLRAVNTIVALVALLLLLPLILLIVIAIKLDSRGPVLYRQLRVGLDRRGSLARDQTGRRVSDLGGRPFMICKFRTMHVDAELDSGPVWAAPDDHRATRAGRWLRRARFDEIPQFLNVLKGEMSVVGPRPERPNFVLELQREIDGYRLRNRVPPGITGWAQVNRGYDRSVADVRAKLDYDLEYVRRRSLWFDFLIMLRTLPVILEGEKHGHDG